MSEQVGSAELSPAETVRQLVDAIEFQAIAMHPGYKPGDAIAFEATDQYGCLHKRGLAHGPVVMEDGTNELRPMLYAQAGSRTVVHQLLGEERAAYWPAYGVPMRLGGDEMIEEMAEGFRWLLDHMTRYPKFVRAYPPMRAEAS